MPTPKTRALFISHAWRHDEHYWKVVNWFNEEPIFSWKNCSVPSHDGLSDTTKEGLRAALTRQVTPAQGVIVLAGMYVAHSEWIDYEIDEAVRMDKVIIGVRPWGHERISTKVSANSDIIVGWNRASVIGAVRDLV